MSNISHGCPYTMLFCFYRNNNCEINEYQPISCKYFPWPLYRMPYFTSCPDFMTPEYCIAAGYSAGHWCCLFSQRCLGLKWLRDSSGSELCSEPEAEALLTCLAISTVSLFNIISHVIRVVIFYHKPIYCVNSSVKSIVVYYMFASINISCIIPSCPVISALLVHTL